MTAEELKRIGLRLCPPRGRCKACGQLVRLHWQREIALFLDVTERTVRRWYADPTKINRRTEIVLRKMVPTRLPLRSL